MYEFLIFDADHTLFDFDKAEKIALKRVLHDDNCIFNDTKLRLYKEINKVLWAKYEQKEITQSEIKTERFKLFYKQIGFYGNSDKASENYLQYLSLGAYLLPGAEDLIFNLKKDYILGLLTNGISKVQHPRLERSVINNVFDAVMVSGDVGISKPDPGLFELLCQKAGYHNKAKMLMIGDSLTSDMQGGVNFGIDTCWFNPSGKLNFTEVRPTYEIKNLEEIYEILNGV